jgi:hypothetical protein
MRLHNKTILDKPFIFDINPAYSTNAKHSQDLVSLSSIKIIEIVPYNARYPFWLYFHYAPDAAYLKINPMVQLSIREKDIRDNKSNQFYFAK